MADAAPKTPKSIPDELRSVWPSHVSLLLINSEKLIDPDSASADEERRSVIGTTTVIAEVELFPGTSRQKKMSRRSSPVKDASKEVCRQTVNHLAQDVRKALDEWRHSEMAK